MSADNAWICKVCRTPIPPFSPISGGISMYIYPDGSKAHASCIDRTRATEPPLRQAEPATQTQDWVASILRAGLSEPPLRQAQDQVTFVLDSERYEKLLAILSDPPKPYTDLIDLLKSQSPWEVPSDPGREARDAVIEEAIRAVADLQISRAGTADARTHNGILKLVLETLRALKSPSRGSDPSGKTPQVSD